MKQYTMAGTDSVVEFGDMIQLDFTKDMPNGKVKHQHLDCKFLPGLVPMLLEEGIIEEHEITDNPEEKQEETVNIEDVLETFDGCIERLDALEKAVEELTAVMNRTVREVIRLSGKNFVKSAVAAVKSNSKKAIV